ncbi:hypothetical protein SUGI_0625910 [Cryptomeria japonica]|nr:hypothetical protein SUGI_0625910 [Cryptomeria japonica]
MGLFRDPRVKNVSEGDQDLQPLTNEGFPPPKDSFNLAYLSYFTLGAGFLLPWNAYITAIDYFSYIYPGKQKSSARFRINLGLSLFLLCLLVVPVMDAAYIKGRRGLDVGYYITVTAVVGCGIADAFVQGSLIGSAGELPEEFMQAVVAGTAASGVLVSALRILTKGALPQDVEGLRISAILYFIVSSVLMGVCLVCYNMANRLPVIRYYNDLKERAMESKFLLGDTIVNNSADTEDMSFPVTSKNLFGAPKEGGKSLTAYFMLESATIAIGGSVARLLFYPLFYGCLHGPHFFRTEIPVVLLTCLLGLTNGYFTSVIMIVAPKTVPLQEAETAGIIIVLFLVIGLAIGSIVAWFWVI